MSYWHMSGKFITYGNMKQVQKTLHKTNKKPYIITYGNMKQVHKLTNA